jgi:hypothetical protein
MKDPQQDAARLKRLENAARGASGMLRIALRTHDEGTAPKQRLIEVMLAAAELLERALGERDVPPPNR